MRPLYPCPLPIRAEFTATSPDAWPSDPILAAIDRAPRVQRLTPEQRAELEQDLADIAAGRARLVAHEDLPQALEELAREQDD